MKIYVASSWRNDEQPVVVAALRDAGHEVYDFRHPSKGDDGFHWSEIDQNWKGWSVSQYLQALDNPIAERGYSNDYDAMVWADACVLVMPCGRSAHLELGWFVGKGRRTCILHNADDPMEPELMTKMCNAQFDSINHVVDWLAR